MSLLQVKNLRVEFPGRRGTLRALDDMSFDIAPGEILGVVGESGAGKSLTGAAIIGLLEPPGRVASGEILLRRPAHRQPAVRRDAQGARAPDRRHLPGPADLAEPAVHGGPPADRNHHHSPARERTPRRASAPSTCCKDTGIPAAEQRIDHYPHQFSGGMRQRVVIALALAAEPQLIVADEPTTALDVSIQAQIITLLKTICKQRGAAVMLITHDMGVIAETCDRVAVMYAGRIAEIGPVHDVIHHPAHPYTRQGLMACIPDMSEDRERLHQIDGAMPRLNAIPTGCAYNPRCDGCSTAAMWTGPIC